MSDLRALLDAPDDPSDDAREFADHLREHVPFAKMREYNELVLSDEEAVALITARDAQRDEELVERMLTMIGSIMPHERTIGSIRKAFEAAAGSAIERWILSWAGLATRSKP